MNESIVLRNVTGRDVLIQGRIVGNLGRGLYVRSASFVPPPQPPTPPVPPTANFAYMTIQRGSGNFIYNIYDTITDTWAYSVNSGYDATFTFSQAGFVGNKFYTLFTKSGITYLQFISLQGSIVQNFNISTSNAGFGLFFSISNVLFAAFYANSTTQIGHFRYEPFSDTVTTTDINVTSFNNYFATVYYNLILIRYRISESPVLVAHALWPITQSGPSSPAYIATGGSPGIFTGVNNFGATTGSISNNTHFAFNSDGQSIVPTISGTAVQGLSAIVAAGFGPSNKGRQIVRIQRGNYFEYYAYDYDSITSSPIYLNPLVRITVAANMSFGYLRQNTYTTGLTSLPSNTLAVSEQNSSVYTNAVTISTIVTPGNYTDISGSVVGGRTFSLSRIAYNTQYKESTFGFVTGNNDNPIVTMLYMTNGSTWIQGSGTVAGTRGTMTVTNSTGSYSLNKFFTVETMIPILEPNDSVIDLPVASNQATQRAWNTVHQTLTISYFNPCNFVINQGTTGMLIKPRNTTSIVRQVEFTAGDLTINRDPLTFTLEGSNDNGATYTTIVANSATNIGSLAASRYFKYYSSVFANSTAYSLYRLTFPTLRSGVELQLQKVQFMATPPAGYLMDGSVNASITLNRNQTYHFKVNAPSDIFWIQTVPAPYSAANAYNTGVTNNGCKSSILTFAVPAGAPATLYYVSQTDPTKTGTINIVDSGAPGGNISGTWWAHINTAISSRSYADVWFSVENATQWGTSGVSIIQDTRPGSAPAAGASYRYVMGASGQNYLFGKMFVSSESSFSFSNSAIQIFIQQYVLNLNLFNTFSAISLPKLYTHVTPSILYTLPSWTSSVVTDPNGFGLFQDQCATFNLTAYNNITVRRIASRLISSGSQQFDIYYRIGGVLHNPGTSTSGSSGTFSYQSLPNGSVNFTFIPPVSNSSATTQLFDGTSWGNFEAPFSVTAGVQITVNRASFFITGKTQIRLFDLNTSTLIDGPYNFTPPIAASPPTISAANGWTQLTVTGTPTAIPGIHNSFFLLPLISGSLLNINISAGQTVGFCIRSSTNLIFQGNSTGSTQQFFENNDFRITTGDNAGYVGNAGPTMPFTLSNTPNSFSGYIEAIRTTVPDLNASITLTTFNPIYRYGDVYTLLGTESVPRRFSYTIPTLFVTATTMIRFNNTEYAIIPETDQYNVNIRIVRDVGSGDIVVPIRSNMISLPFTFAQSMTVSAFQGYVYVSAQYQGTQRNYVFIRLTDGTIVASGSDPSTTESIQTTGTKLIRLNSNNTITMFRNGILETFTANTFSAIVRMRSDVGNNDTLFAYSTARALALTDSGYTVITFPTPLSTINSTILANNYLILIQLNPLRIYAISPSGILYTYSLDVSATLVRRLNTDTTMSTHVTYISGGTVHLAITFDITTNQFYSLTTTDSVNTIVSNFIYQPA